MGFMKDQAPRLTRERWADVNELAEEIYAIWMSEVPVKFDSPIVINNETRGPAMTINQGGTSDQTIIINRNPGPGDPLPPGYPPGSPGGGDTIFIDNSVTIINYDGVPEPHPDPPPPPEDPQPGTGDTINLGGGGFPGKVISKVSGAIYDVAVYESGLSQSPTTRRVTQLQIHEDATIPADTWTIVGQAGSGANLSRFMSVPVWLEDLA